MPRPNYFLQEEIKLLQQKIQQLELENQELKVALQNAKDPTPIVRFSFKRVAQLVRQCCMELLRWGSGWLLRMGNHRARKFKSLKDIWNLLNQEDWCLSDILPPDLPPPLPPKSVKLPLPKLESKETFPYVSKWQAEWSRILVHERSEFT